MSQNDDLDNDNPLMVAFFANVNNMQEKKIAVWRVAALLNSTVKDLRAVTDEEFELVRKMISRGKPFVLGAHQALLASLDSLGIDYPQATDFFGTVEKSPMALDTKGNRKRAPVKRTLEGVENVPVSVKKDKKKSIRNSTSEETIDLDHTADENSDAMDANKDSLGSPFVFITPDSNIVSGQDPWPLIEEITSDSKHYTGERLENLRKALMEAAQTNDIQFSVIARKYTIPLASFKKYIIRLKEIAKRDSTHKTEETSIKVETVDYQHDSKKQSTNKGSKKNKVEIYIPTRPCPYVAADTQLPSYVLDDLDKGKAKFAVPLYPRPGGKTRLEVQESVMSAIRAMSLINSTLNQTSQEVLQEAVDMVLMDGRSVEYTSCVNGILFNELYGLCCMVYGKLTDNESSEGKRDGLQGALLDNIDLEVFRLKLISSLTQTLNENGVTEPLLVLCCVDILVDSLPPSKVSIRRAVKASDLESTSRKIRDLWNPEPLVSDAKLLNPNMEVLQEWLSHYKTA